MMPRHTYFPESHQEFDATWSAWLQASGPSASIHTAPFLIEGICQTKDVQRTLVVWDLYMQSECQMIDI